MLFEHQQQAIEFARSREGRCAIFHEMGLGKTLTALSLYDQLCSTKDNQDLKLLVIAPLSLLESAWMDDIKKFIPIFTSYCFNIHENKKKFLAKKIFPGHKIFLVNYEFLVSSNNVRSLVNFYQG